jgi:hypothetical protein
MNNKVIEIFENAMKLEDTGINFFSGLSRKFHKYPNLKLNFEIYAKSKISTKKLISDIIRSLKSQSITVKNTEEYDFQSSEIDIVIDNTDVVGEYSLPEDVLKVAFNYLRSSNNLYNFLRQKINTSQGLDKIIAENKSLLELIKKQIHQYPEEVSFYGYE